MIDQALKRFDEEYEKHMCPDGRSMGKDSIKSFLKQELEAQEKRLKLDEEELKQLCILHANHPYELSQRIIELQEQDK